MPFIVYGWGRGHLRVSKFPVVTGVCTVSGVYTHRFTIGLAALIFPYEIF